MAYCGNYKDMSVDRPTGASELPNARILQLVRIHKNPAWWKKTEGFASNPDRYAYNRRWAGVVRREARSRGLL